jgi:hypothetical protein
VTVQGFGHAGLAALADERLAQASHEHPHVGPGDDVL